MAKDTRLQAGVPQVKRKLEQFLFHVIALMENNNCKGAFSTGNLKHRDIRGDVISSQIPRSDEESDEPVDDDLGLDLDDNPDANGSDEDDREDDSDGDQASHRQSKAR
ncbi:hypothetical protein IWW38_005545 [Coemansia aciculifera]|uniref:Uncharacterized protein n=1 Tax=Coemansia aciculifera TaxID=417176 RepID=A0ACC1LW75_9FUNG|nr:hypothetical protein IWW38_005545 [Coemansia aciculifera]